MNPLWNLDLLGPLTLRNRQQQLTHFRTHKTAALLGFLALERRPHTRESLIARLWPDANLENGRNSLSVSLSALRRQLEPSPADANRVLIADRNFVTLNPALVATDIEDFCAVLRAPRASQTRAQLQSALDAYRGRFLDGLYEDWIVREAGKFETLWLRGLDWLLEMLEAEADFAAMQHYATQSLAAAPWRESSHLALLRALAAQGETSAALDHYRAHQSQSELRTPSPSLRALVRSLEEQVSGRPLEIAISADGIEDPSAASSAGTNADPNAVSSAMGVGFPARRTRFFGRRAVLNRLMVRLRPGLPSESRGTQNGWAAAQNELHGAQNELHGAQNESSAARLVTLTGLGGGGKTRLAQELARGLGEAYANRVWFVPLAGLPEASLLDVAVRDGLHLIGAPGAAPLDQIVGFLADAPALLILDNFESLLPAGAAWVALLLVRLPQLLCLVTSRQRLEIEGEEEVPLRPLPTPRASHETFDVPQLARFAGVRLFVDRARAARPGFALTRRNAAAVAQLCRALEGIPLALELAAARADVLSPAQMLAGFENRAQWLQTSRPEVPERHRSMQAAIGASYALLPPELQRFFRFQAVFRGAWQPEVAAQVCEEPRALHFASQMRAASLLHQQEQAQETRFWSLETLREFAAAQLSEAEETRLRGRHAAHFLGSLDGKAALTASPAQRDKVRADFNDLRAALDFWIENEPQTGLQLAIRLWPWWEALGSLEEGTTQLERAALGAPEAPLAMRAQAFFGAGQLAYYRDFALARPLLETSLGLFRAADDRAGIAQVLCPLSTLLMNLRDPRCGEMAAQALELAREVGNRPLEAEAAYSLGVMLLGADDTAGARPLLEGCEAYARELGDEAMLAKTLDNLGMLAWRTEKYPQAGAHFAESLALARRLGIQWLEAHSLWGVSTSAREAGDFPTALQLAREAVAMIRQGQFLWFMPYLFALLAYTELELGWFDHAITLLGAAQAGHEAHGMPLVPLFQPLHERYLGKARAGVSESHFEELWARGVTLSGEAALDFALQPEPK